MTREEVHTMRSFEDERGIAMITGLLVAFVVMLLSISITSMAIHSTASSDYNRRRLFAVGAAEAGVNRYYSYLGNLYNSEDGTTNTLTTMQCSKTGNVSTGPSVGSWTATLTLFTSAGASIACPPPSGTVPAYAKVSSVGQAPSGNTIRRMESYIRLIPVRGGFSAAVLSSSTTTATNQLTIEGDQGDDADMYVSCPASNPTCTIDLTLSNNQSISGSLYVQGSVTINNAVNISGNVWAKGNVTLTNTAHVFGNVISSTGAISVSTPAIIDGDATAAGAISSVSRVGGLVSTPVTSPNPPSTAMPQIGWTASEQAAWAAAGYTILTASGTGSAACSDALTKIANISSGVLAATDYVVRIPVTCDLAFSNNTARNVPGNLAIITEGSITMQNRVVWTATGGDRQLYLISTWATRSCGTAPGPYDITTSNNTDFQNVSESPILTVFMYSPCAVNLYNSSVFNGQVYGGSVNIQNQTTINFSPATVPGAGTVTGFKEDVAYIREVTTTG
jgi:cytoskeletal protein CcmA (bactofilin family)